MEQQAKFDVPYLVASPEEAFIGEYDSFEASKNKRRHLTQQVADGNLVVLSIQPDNTYTIYSLHSENDTVVASYRGIWSLVGDIDYNEQHVVKIYQSVGLECRGTVNLLDDSSAPALDVTRTFHIHSGSTWIHLADDHFQSRDLRGFPQKVLDTLSAQRNGFMEPETLRNEAELLISVSGDTYSASKRLQSFMDTIDHNIEAGQPIEALKVALIVVDAWTMGAPNLPDVKMSLSSFLDKFEPKIRSIVLHDANSGNREIQMQILLAPLLEGYANWRFLFQQVLPPQRIEEIDSFLKQLPILFPESYETSASDEISQPSHKRQKLSETEYANVNVEQDDEEDIANRQAVLKLELLVQQQKAWIKQRVLELQQRAFQDAGLG